MLCDRRFQCVYLESFLRRREATRPCCSGTPTQRNCRKALAPAITILFNRSLSEGNLPPCMKLANITPVPKTDRPCQVSHFRPISLLPILAKVLEKFVAERWLIPSIREKMSASQFAYVPGPGKGPCMALTTIYLSILEHLDSTSGAVRVLSIDLSKAFDVITPSSILNACHSFQIPLQAYQWIKSYLSDRKQRVKLGDECSNWTHITSGVPQGSVLGPLLFCMTTNKLSPIHKNSTIIQYADDITLLHFLRNPNDDKLHEEFAHLEQWAESLSLSINRNKCSVMDVVTKQNLVLQTLPNVHSVSHFKLLGVMLSSDMKWASHIDFIVKKASRRMFLLLNLRRANSPPDVIFKAYCAFIRSLLLYSFPVFCNIPAYLKQRLLRIEKRVFRLLGASTGDFPSLFSTADKICERIFEDVIRHNDHPLRGFFTHRTSRTRSSVILHPPRCKTSRFSESFIKFSL